MTERWVRVASSDDLSLSPDEASTLSTASADQLEVLRPKALEDVLKVARMVAADLTTGPKFEVGAGASFMLGMVLGRMATIDDRTGR